MCALRCAGSSEWAAGYCLRRRQDLLKFALPAVFGEDLAREFGAAGQRCLGLEQQHLVIGVAQENCLNSRRLALQCLCQCRRRILGLQLDKAFLSGLRFPGESECNGGDDRNTKQDVQFLQCDHRVSFLYLFLHCYLSRERLRKRPCPIPKFLCAFYGFSDAKAFLDGYPIVALLSGEVSQSHLAKTSIRR